MDSPAQIRLLIADVDGTLVTQEKVLTDQAVAAVQDLHRAGIRFVVTSGRPPRGMRMLIDALALRCPLAGFNGGAYTHPDLTTIETRSLSPDAARIALDAVLNAGIDAWVYTADEWFARDPDAPHARREASTVEFEATIVPEFTDDHLAQVVKIVGIS
ncbi:MAG TPA: HAD-IIB family hydrolase, partial [Acetobacteraceae bacterium]|nr:HAD-IIB family hydrolase [Acetobacteraceae bacterium]